MEIKEFLEKKDNWLNEVKKLRTLWIFILLLFINFNIVYAQQQTAYEKKKTELLLQIWQKYGQRTATLIGNTLSNKTDKEVFEYAKAAEEGIAVAALYGKSDERFNAIIWYAKELKKIQKLKTAAELKQEKDRQTLLAQQEFEKTDYGSIYKSIKSDFQPWNQKGEFEKQIDYDERLKNQSKDKFIEVCIKKTQETIKNFGGNDSQLRKELLKYNSEDESFTVSFKFKEKEWQNKLKIPIEKAEGFKEKWNQLKWQKNHDDWCLIGNDLFPTIITLAYSNTYKEEYSNTDDEEYSNTQKEEYSNTQNVDNTTYSLDLPLKGQTEITIPFDKLEMQNTYLKNFVFKYSLVREMEMEIARQKFVQDSLDREMKLEIARQEFVQDSLENIPYNEKLETVFQDYNNQLLQNPYNIEKKIIPDYKKMGMNKDKKENFEKLMNALKENFEIINENVQQELKNKNPKEYAKIYYGQNPEKQTEANKLFLNCRCSYSKEEFDIKFVIEPISCNCYQKEYGKYRNFFPNIQEFKTFYEQGDEVLLAEVTKREEEQVINYLTQNEITIEGLNFKDANSKSKGTGGQIAKDLLEGFTGISVPQNSNSELVTNEYIILIDRYKEKPYYNNIMDFLVEKNKKLNKEWNKSKDYFESKIEFYNAYISGEYKQILKDKKKNLKRKI
jgi:hypothetical protein